MQAEQKYLLSLYSIFSSFDEYLLAHLCLAVCLIHYLCQRNNPFFLMLSLSLSLALSLSLVHSRG